MGPAAEKKTIQEALLSACERLVQPQLADAAARLMHTRLIALCFGGSFLLAAAIMSVTATIGPVAAFAGVAAVLAAGLSLGLATASRGLVGPVLFGAAAVGAVIIGLLVAIAGGGASPLLLLAPVLGFEIWQLRGTHRTMSLALASAIGAIFLGTLIVPQFVVQGAPSAAQWLAPFLYGLLVALRFDPRLRKPEVAAAATGDPDLFLLGDRVAATLSQDGSVEALSANAETLLGLAPELLLGAGLFDRLRVTDRVAYRCAIADAAAGKPVQPLEVNLRMPGEPRAIYQPFQLDFARETGARVRLVVEPLGEIARLRRELAETRDAVDQGETAKSRFLAAVSHELRTPLNAIIGFSDFLMHEEIAGPLAPRQREQLGHIREAGHHLLSVVNAILDVTKIESGTYAISLERCSVAELVGRATAMLSEQAAARRIAMTTRIDADAGQLMADPRAVQQMLINLLSNAIKFTEDGGRIEIRARQREGRVLLSVSDTGIGIAADDLERLCKPFAQVQNDYTRKFEGTGLGLSLVKGLVELHRGTMSIESAPCLGTSVTIGLPGAEDKDANVSGGEGHEAPRKIA